MKVSCIGLDYGFGGVPILSFGLPTDLVSITTSKTKDIELAIGGILEGRQVVLSGKDITIHSSPELATHEATMYTSLCQTNAELVAANEDLKKRLEAAGAEISILQEVVDGAAEAIRVSKYAEDKLLNYSTAAKLHRENFNTATEYLMKDIMKWPKYK